MKPTPTDKSQTENSANPQSQGLQEGWVWKSLGEALPILYGKGLTALNRDQTGQVPVFGSSGAVGLHSNSLTSKPALVIGRKGSVGEVYYSTVPCWPIDTTYYAEENPYSDLRYFYYLLKSLNLANLDKSTAVPGLSRDDYNKVLVPLAPLPVQKLIVAEIEKQFSRLDEAVAGLKRVKANLKRYKAAVLKAAVEGRLTEEWRGNYPDVEPSQQLLVRIKEQRDKWIKKSIEEGQNEPRSIRSKLIKHKFDIPEGEGAKVPQTWEWASLLTICQMVVDCHNKTAPYEKNGIPLVRTTNIKNGHLQLNEVNFVSQETYVYWSRRCPPKPGDILFTREAPMGECAVIPEGAKVCMGQRIMLLRVSHDLTNVKYLAYAIMSPPFQAYLNSVAIGTGVKHLRVGDVESLVVPFPPLEEQNKIVAEVERRLSVAEEIEAVIETNLKRTERMRQAILKKAFEGRLLPQNAGYEPADKDNREV